MAVGTPHAASRPLAMSPVCRRYIERILRYRWMSGMEATPTASTTKATAPPTTVVSIPRLFMNPSPCAGWLQLPPWELQVVLGGCSVQQLEDAQNHRSALTQHCVNDH